VEGGLEDDAGGAKADRPPNAFDGSAGEDCCGGELKRLVICAFEKCGCDELGDGEDSPFVDPRDSAPPCPYVSPPIDNPSKSSSSALPVFCGCEDVVDD
jgi:hypothetical protein